MILSSDELADLLGAVGRGDRPAFRQVYERTAAKLLGVISRIIRDRSQAEDVLQEVYLRVWQNAGSYVPGSGRPMTWLITVARNRAIDVVRQRREVTASQDGEGRDLLDRIADPRDEGAAFEDADELSRCLGQLEEQQRRCLIEAYHEGRSREELAVRYDRPVNTIKTWLHRSTGALRKCLGEP